MWSPIYARYGDNSSYLRCKPNAFNVTQLSVLQPAGGGEKGELETKRLIRAAGKDLQVTELVAARDVQ